MIRLEIVIRLESIYGLSPSPKTSAIEESMSWRISDSDTAKST